MTLRDKMLKHKNRSIEYMRKAELLAVKNTHMEFRVYIGVDGMPFIFEDIAGSNWYPTCYEVCLYTACYQHADDVLYMWTDSHGLHPHAYMRDNRDALMEMWEQAFYEGLECIERQ